MQAKVVKKRVYIVTNYTKNMHSMQGLYNNNYYDCTLGHMYIQCVYVNMLHCHVLLLSIQHYHSAILGASKIPVDPQDFFANIIVPHCIQYGMGEMLTNK